MKPHEIYNLWVLFDKAMNDPAFSTEQKIAIGKDMLAGLPPEMLCSSSKPTLSAVTQAMKGRLNEYTRSTGKTGLCTGTSALARPEGVVSKEDEGDGVSLANLGDPKESKKKAKATRSVEPKGKHE
jgi:hypothetical protein